MPPHFRALTITGNGLLRALRTECEACPAFDPNTVPQSQHPTLEKFTAIWDTGASGSVITQAVVDRCGLQPTGMVKVWGVHGLKEAETYLVNFRLPNRVMIYDMKVTKGEITPGVDLLIGMDVITKGDFSVTNVNGCTCFSFRVPSLERVDFTAEARRISQRAQRTQAKHDRRKQRKQQRSKKRPWDK